MSKLGCTDIHFIESGIKVNGAYYRDNLLAQKLLPDMAPVGPGRIFLCSNRTVPRRIEHAFLERETPDLIPPTLWPPISPVDYSIWSVLQEKIYHSRINDLEELKTRLIDEWAQLDQSIVDAAVGQWRRRLCACVSVRGAHFEHKF